jgi:hypothetical protein
MEDEPDRRISVLIGPVTFSAGQNMATWLERNTTATFVGAPTGGSPNHFGDSAPFPLAGGLSVIVSTRRWNDSDPEDDRQWILPDLPARPTAAEDDAGLDIALQAAIELPSHQPFPAGVTRWARPSQSAPWLPAWSVPAG